MAEKRKNVFAKAGQGIASTAKFFWSWTIIYKSRNSPQDSIYADVWKTPVDEASIHTLLQKLFPDIRPEDLPTEEEEIRRLIRDSLPPLAADKEDDERGSLSSDERTIDANQYAEQRDKQLSGVTEENWESTPAELQNLLAAMNIRNAERKLELMQQDNFHCKSGKGSVGRSISGTNKTFRMYREGFKAATSKREQLFVNFLFIFLTVCATYPDVAAGFLGERSYNQRSIGGRIVTLSQLFFIWRYPNHSAWLIFNWSLERLLGAFAGSTVYALAAVVPAIHRAYSTNWFRIMMLGISLSWQLTVQFAPAARDYVVRLLNRRQMSAMRSQAETGAIDWEATDQTIDHELQTLKRYNANYVATDKQPVTWERVPIRARIERYIQFTSRFKLGRPADQLVGLLKDDLEGIIETYEDYHSTAPKSADKEAIDAGHVEPRTPKFLLVVFDLCIFTYVCYSFFPQPFTFNTVVAYGTVVSIKQTIIAFKRYQTPKSARRVFTNMVSINIIGMLLVSTPVTVDRHVLENDTNFILLTISMVLATIFLAEPIAPLMLKLVEGIVTGCNKLSVMLKPKKKDAKELESSGSVTSSSTERESVKFNEKGQK